MKCQEVYCFIYGCVPCHEESGFKYQPYSSLIFVQPYHMVFVKTDQVNTFFFSPHFNAQYLLLSFGAALRIEPRAQCMLGKHSSIAHLPSPIFTFYSEILLINYPVSLEFVILLPQPP